MDRFLILLVALVSLSSVQGQNCTEYASNSAVQLLQQYVRINTTTYNDLTPAVKFWQDLAAAEGVPITVTNFTAGFPVITMKWAGTNSSAPSIVLNSHMDVVPADEADGWTYPPFDAVLTADCEIWGRGTQDMKSVSLQYFLAMKELVAENVSLTRDVYMTLMPDEEVGAANGMQKLLLSDEWKKMNVGLEMDEGTSYDLPYAALFKQDKSIWQIQINCTGTASHGSTFSATNATAVGKCHNVTSRLFQYRDEQYKISQTATILNSGSYTSVNLNYIRAGSAYNVVPALVTQVYDIRLATTLDDTTFDANLRQWIAESGENITMSYVIKNPQTPATMANTTNPYYVAIKTALNNVSLPFLSIVAPGSTDARFVRKSGVPAFGFSPMPNTTLLLHSVNEHLKAKIFVQGISVYKSIITQLANVDPATTSANGSDYLVNTTTTSEESTSSSNETTDTSSSETLKEKIAAKVKDIIKCIRNE